MATKSDSQDTSSRSDSHEMLLSLNIEGSGKHRDSGGKGTRVHPSALSRSSTSRAVSFNRSDTNKSVDFSKSPMRRMKSRRGSVVFSLAAGSAVKNASHAQVSESTSKWVIFPNNPYYMAWWYFTVVVAVLNAWFTPFSLAFSSYPGLYPLGDLASIVDIFSFTVFTSDIVLKFFTAYFNPRTNTMVTDLREIRSNYLRGLFWVDFLSTFPFDIPILFALGLNSSTSNTARYICLLKMLRLIRLYRLFEFFDYVEYNMVLGQISLMLIRNITYVVFVTHWAGCLIWFIARSEYFSQNNSWVGRHSDRFTDVNLATQYIYSWYFMMASFSGMGDNDFYSNSPYESTFMIFYQVICLVLGAYILGSVTLLVVKGDERAAVLRSRMDAIKNYAGVNSIPDDLVEAMIANMELQFHVELFSDQIILHSMPTSIRRQILRHMYDQQLRGSYLFNGCSTKFLDAVLFSAHVESYMAGVQVMSPGDVLNELCIIVSGTVVTTATSMDASARTGVGVGVAVVEPVQLREPGFNSGTFNASAMIMRPTQEMILSTSQTFGEVSFFTELPAVDSATTQSVCKIMCLSRSAYANLETHFPDDVRHVLENLQADVTAIAQQELMMAARGSQMGRVSELASGLTSSASSRTLTARRKEEDLLATLSPLQQSAYGYMRSVQDHVSNYCAKMDKERLRTFLSAASTGDDVVVKRMLNMGLDVNAADGDARTALMLAVQKGNKEAIILLLEAGADTKRCCARGFTALYYACRHGHDYLAQKLMKAGATLNMNPKLLAHELCKSAAEGDLAFMRRLLAAGAPADIRDPTSNRTPLHISAAEGNLQAVKLLIEDGEATIDLQDYWGNTPLDEARRVGAASVVTFLESYMDKSQLLEGTSKWQRLRTTNFLSACLSGDVERIRFMLEGSTPSVLGSGIMVAAAQGHKAAVALLQVWIGTGFLDRTLGQTALIEAVVGRHDNMAMLLYNFGASLSSLPDSTSAALLTGAVTDNTMTVLRKLLKAGLKAEARGGVAERTALHAAADLGNLDALRILVEEGGARHDVKDGAGRTPLETAKSANADKGVIEYLEWAGTVKSFDDELATKRFGIVRTASDRNMELLSAKAEANTRPIKHTVSRLGLLKSRNSADGGGSSGGGSGADAATLGLMSVTPVNAQMMSPTVPDNSGGGGGGGGGGGVELLSARPRSVPLLASISTNARRATIGSPHDSAQNTHRSDTSSRPASPFLRNGSSAVGMVGAAAAALGNGATGGGTPPAGLQTRTTVSFETPGASLRDAPSREEPMLRLTSQDLLQSPSGVPPVEPRASPPPAVQTSSGKLPVPGPSDFSDPSSRRGSLRPGRVLPVGSTPEAGGSVSSGPLIMQQHGESSLVGRSAQTPPRPASQGPAGGREFSTHEIESLLKEVDDISANVGKE